MEEQEEYIVTVFQSLIRSGLSWFKDLFLFPEPEVVYLYMYFVLLSMGDSTDNFF